MTHPSAAYRPIDEVVSGLEELAAANPDRVRVEELGRTTKGRPILAFHVAATGEERSSLLVIAGLHALEWISVETADRFLRDLVIAPREHVAVTVVPVVNLDGRIASERSLLRGENRYFRGNGADPPVDLNRDWGVNHEPVGLWSRVSPRRSASTETPLSQPETRALDALADRERYDRAASLHAFGGYLYYPWAGDWRRPDDWAELATLGRELEAAQGIHAYRPKQLSRWGFFFRAHGTELDHLYGEYGTRTFLIELTRSGIRPTRAVADLDDYFRWYNPADPTPHVERGVRALHALADTRP